jgi:tRNA dimethylallyltransferase
MKKPIIIITGPTASGKTDLAIKIAKEFEGEIVNADSRTVYREMDVATAKPSEEEKADIPHHLFDVVKPDDSFTVADYKKLAQEKIREIRNRGKSPILVGGTGLYIDSVVYDFNLTEGKPQPKLREELNELSTDMLLHRLEELDPDSIETIDSSNKRRLVRALEVSMSTGMPFSKQKERKPLPDDVIYLSVDVPREELYDKINRRIEHWLEMGLIEETKRLRQKYSADLPSMSAIGYKEVGDYLEGKISKEEAIEEMKKRTRNYAKRQLTWLRRNPDIEWVKDDKEARVKIEKTLE